MALEVGNSTVDKAGRKKFSLYRLDGDEFSFKLNYLEIVPAFTVDGQSDFRSCRSSKLTPAARSRRPNVCLRSWTRTVGSSASLRARRQAPNEPIYPRPLRQSGKPVSNNPKEVNRPETHRLPGASKRRPPQG